MTTVIRNDHGSALILAVLAMLVLGVLSISFALLADMETKIGVSYKHQGQAEALAEAAFDHARDLVRNAPNTPQGFTTWFAPPWNHILLSNVPLNGGTYSARIDNDCGAAGPPGWFPTAIQEKPHPPGNTPCDNVTDYNQAAVITAWAQSVSGKARVRAVVAVDSPWKHVCSDAKPDNNGYCNEPANRNGNPTVSPSDPNDPNGPAAYNNLPYPVLGCSRIAPELHRGPYSTALQIGQCSAANFPGMYKYPYPVPFNAPPRFVLMGEDPAVTATARTCNNEPNAPSPGNGKTYFGYFDCALTSYCNPVDAGHVCTGFPGLIGSPPPATQYLVGCLKGPKWHVGHGLPPAQGDTRVIAGHPNQVALNPGYTVVGPVAAINNVVTPLRWGEWDPGSLQCVKADGVPVTPGLVFTGPAGFPAGGGTVTFGTAGSQLKQFDTYVYHANWNGGNNAQIYGTVVAETDGTAQGCPSAVKQFQVGNGASTAMWAGVNSPPPVAGWADPSTDPSGSYGYPLFAVIYDPGEPPPTVQPTYAPQPYTADMGSNNSQLHGMIYSGGCVNFNPLQMDGTVVGFNIKTQGSATYTYNPWYGNNTPPAGFPTSAANAVGVIRKSFITCVSYNDDSGGLTGCN